MTVSFLHKYKPYKTGFISCARISYVFTVKLCVNLQNNEQITLQVNTSLHQALYRLKTLLLASPGVVERSGLTTARPTVLVTCVVAILNGVHPG